MAVFATVDGDGNAVNMEAQANGDGSISLYHVEDVTQRAALLSALGSAGNLATGQVVIGNTSTLIAAARTGRQSLTVENHGGVPVFLGSAGVTVSTGIFLSPAAGAQKTFDFSGALYGVTAAGNQTVSEFELFP